MTGTAVVKRLRAIGNPRHAANLSWFFKTEHGGYGEGDKFLGITVPTSRLISKEFASLPPGELEKLLKSRWHEARLVALLIMVRQFTRGDLSAKSIIYRMYLKNLKAINNWDLVDTSARDIVGAHLFERDRAPLFRLAKSKKWHERRVAMIATHYFIKLDDHSTTIELAEQFLGDEHDLMHKAAGWMLREAGLRDLSVLRDFLTHHVARMPRTMLRYSIEKLDASERKRWMSVKRV